MTPPEPISADALAGQLRDTLPDDDVSSIRGNDQAVYFRYTHPSGRTFIVRVEEF